MNGQAGFFPWAVFIHDHGQACADVGLVPFLFGLGRDALRVLKRQRRLGQQQVALSLQSLPIVPRHLVPGYLDDWCILVLIPVERPFGGAVKKRHQLVVLRLCDGIVLVCVAARTNHRHAEEHRAQRLSAVEVVLRLKLSRDHAALRGGGIHPHVACGNQLLRGRIRMEVASKLPLNESIKRHVVIQRAHHPVAVRVDAPLVVEMQAVRVAVSNGIEPVPGLMFPVLGISKEPFHEPLVGVGAVIVQVGIQQLRLRWQAGQHQREPTRQGGSTGGLCKTSALRELLFNKSVNRMPLARRRRLNRGDERPVLGVFAALLDPALNQFPLVRCELFFGILRRHGIVRVIDAGDNLALRRRLGIDGLVAFQIACCALERVEPDEVFFPRVRPVADEAFVGKYRQDFACKIHRLLRRQ